MLHFLKFTEIILLMTTILSSLPPGFRFHPTDEELILYLNNKVSSSPISVSAPSIISEIDLYKLDPWELPDKAYFGDRQWFCFSPRERKYPKGARPNRRAASGYWKATGSDRAIVCSDGWQYVGVKKSLIFYKGRAPKGTKTNWIMQEYRLPNSSPITGSMTLDEWVLCRIQHKGGVAEAAKEEGGSSSNACSFEGEINWDEKSGTTSVKDALDSIKRVLSLDEHEWASSNSSSF